MNISQYIIKKLANFGIDKAFMVTGGAAMFLNNAIGEEKKIKKIYCHHEQSAAIAAESYSRLKKKPAIVNITAGPGVLNSLNGVFGAYTDSLPMIILSGQAKKETSLQFKKIKFLRQLGDQELKTIEIVKSITKKQFLIKDVKNLSDIISDAYNTAISGRPGPVWIDVPIDVQSYKITFSSRNKKRTIKKLQKFKKKKFNIKKVFEMINHSSKPLILAGSGLKISSSEKLLKEFLKSFQIPLVTAWSHDIIETKNKLFIGRQGTIGTRAGNFATQNCDLLIILGSRLNIRQVSYNYKSFAKNAKLIWIDIDKKEFKKNFIKKSYNLNIDVKFFLKEMISFKKKNKIKSFNLWLDWCYKLKKLYTPKYSDYKSYKDINPYHFIHQLFEHIKKNDIIVCADATATIVPFQIGTIKKGVQLVSNSGCASMGYDLPACIGALEANKKLRIICLAGDGSIMMNLQDLAILTKFQNRLKIFILNNDGYLSIKQTQKNFFGQEYGASSNSGLSMPDFKKVGNAFNFRTAVLRKKDSNWKKKLNYIMNSKKISLVEVKLALEQEFEPRLKSKKINEKIFTPELDDMYPFLPYEELSYIRSSLKKIK